MQTQLTAKIEGHKTEENLRAKLIKLIMHIYIV